ncbi:MAG TPA: PepSY-associated TM helix domain-containing protein [Acidimicrobiales bacterium]
MTEASVSPASPTTTIASSTEALDDGARATRLRPILWRLHFLGGILAAPVAVWLALTGLLFAWNPQIESWLYGDEMRATAEGEPQPLADQLEAALAAHPDNVVVSVEPASGPGEATGVLMRPAGARAEGFGPAPGALTAYVDPVSAEVTGRVAEDERPDEWLRNLHSNFRIGTGPGTLTELAASWVLVALLTGLYLWWPRSRRALRRALAPRLSGLRGGGRRPWRNLHSTLGAALFVVLGSIIVTGLTWTEYAGRWVDVAKDSLSVEAPMLNTDLAAAEGDEGSAGGDHAEHRAGEPGSAASLAAIDRVVDGAEAAGLTAPFTVTPASGSGQAWKVAEIDSRWPIDRTQVAIDPETGDVVDRIEFSDQALLDQATAVGIAFHEGSLFGLANQVLLTLMAVALLVLLVAGYMTWWRRRPAGAFGAPPKVGSLLRTAPVPLLAGFVVLLVLLPTLGVAFVGYLVIERLVRLVRHRRPPAPTPA